MYANVKKCETIITNNYIRIKYPPPQKKVMICLGL